MGYSPKYSPRRAVAFAAVLGVALAVSACGFTPLYAVHGDSVGSPTVAQDLTKITIRPLVDRQGVKLRQVLHEVLQPQGPSPNPQYDLDVTLTTRVEELGIRKDATSSRANLIISASFYMSEASKRVFGDHVQSIVSYNILDDQYATVAAQADAENRAIREIGDDIRTRLAIYFTQRAKTKPVAQATP